MVISPVILPRAQIANLRFSFWQGSLAMHLSWFYFWFDLFFLFITDNHPPTRSCKVLHRSKCNWATWYTAFITLCRICSATSLWSSWCSAISCIALDPVWVTELVYWYLCFLVRKPLCCLLLQTTRWHFIFLKNCTMIWYLVIANLQPTIFGILPTTPTNSSVLLKTNLFSLNTCS